MAKVFGDPVQQWFLEAVSAVARRPPAVAGAFPKTSSLPKQGWLFGDKMADGRLLTSNLFPDALPGMSYFCLSTFFGADDALRASTSPAHAG